MNYYGRLPICNLKPLELRRLHNDLIMLYKILHSLEITNMNNYISVSQTNYGRDNLHKLVEFRVKCNVRKFFYAYRIVDVWNSSNNHVAACTTINSFVQNFKNVCVNNYYLKGQDVK